MIFPHIAIELWVDLSLFIIGILASSKGKIQKKTAVSITGKNRLILK